MTEKKQENSGDDLLYTDFEKEIQSLKARGKQRYKEITEAGEGFKRDVFNFLKIIWDSETIPKAWDLTTLVQIFKRGDRSSLSSYRFIHLKNWMPRILDGIVLRKRRRTL